MFQLRIPFGSDKSDFNPIQLVLNDLKPPNRGIILHQVREKFSRNPASIRRPQNVKLSPRHLLQ